MFGKKFFSTVALSGATVSMVGSVSNVYSYNIKDDFLEGTQDVVDYFEMSKSEFELFRSNMELALKALSNRLRNQKVCVNPKEFSFFENDIKFLEFFSPNCLNAVVDGDSIRFFKIVGTSIHSMESSIDAVRSLLKMLEDKAFVDRIIFSK